VVPDVEPNLRTSVLDTFSILTPERGARIGERRSSDFDRRVRSESGKVAFPFQSCLDSGESAAGRLPDIVHQLSRKHVKFEYDENVGSEVVNRSSCPSSVSMSGDVDRVFAVVLPRLFQVSVRAKLLIQYNRGVEFGV